MAMHQRTQHALKPRPDGLGWFSIGLGLGGVLAPGLLARMIGVGDAKTTRVVLRLVGFRELASGVGILSSRRPAGWLWARVAGDAMDLALLTAALASPRAQRGRVAAATTAMAGVTALDVTQSLATTSTGTDDEHAVTIARSITINRPAHELYRYWCDFANLPHFMERVESVQVTGDRRSHWRAKGPLGTPVEWDAEITDDRPNELIAWHALPGAPLNHSGVVRFQRAPGGRGTEVTLEIRYAPPGGAVTATLARAISAAPEQIVQEDLRRFKQLMETGEIVVGGEAA